MFAASDLGLHCLPVTLLEVLIKMGQYLIGFVSIFWTQDEVVKMELLNASDGYE